MTFSINDVKKKKQKERETFNQILAEEKETLRVIDSDLSKTLKEFLALEQTIKDKNSDSLPSWVKDNRNWHELDKEFQR